MQKHFEMLNLSRTSLWLAYGAKWDQIAILWVVCTSTVLAQIPFDAGSVRNQFSFDREKNLTAGHRTVRESRASKWFDVLYYNLSLDVSTQPNYLIGKVRIDGICRRDSSRSLMIDLATTMHVDSVRSNNQRINFLHQSNGLDITLDRLYQSGEVISVDVFYQGTPLATGFGSFVFAAHSEVPWVYTLSEPFGAQDWWPCKNDPSDKADSADILVTCDSSFRVGSQGVLLSITDAGAGRSTYHWRERYPIASYLISVSLTNYARFSDWFRYSASDSMEVLNYVLPEHYSVAVENLPRVVDMLSIYSSLFGLYPFIREKYGHAEFGSGGMEHQTMSSIGTFDEEVLAHELAHQWFGDMITCRSWSDLWLNEGFAQYCTGLYREQKYGSASYWEYIRAQLGAAMSAAGRIGAPDTSSPAALFNSQLIYSKGAFVLHMLRHVLGDSVFFRSLRTYANLPSLKYSTASTQDFQRVCESVAGQDLAYFFQEWIYGAGFPVYEYSWNWKPKGDSAVVTIELTQPADRTNPAFFTMPIDVRITAVGKETTLTLFNNSRQQVFTIDFPVRPTSVLLDPDGWILKLLFAALESPPAEHLLEQNYPNPFNSTTYIRYRLPRTAHVELKVYDVLGRPVTTLVNARQVPGIYEYPWSASNAATGIYFYRLVAGETRLQKKMILLR